MLRLFLHKSIVSQVFVYVSPTIYLLTFVSFLIMSPVCGKQSMFLDSLVGDAA
jgi:hypothetical protein